MAQYTASTWCSEEIFLVICLAKVGPPARHISGMGIVGWKHLASREKKLWLDKPADGSQWMVPVGSAAGSPFPVRSSQEGEVTGSQHRGQTQEWTGTSPSTWIPAPCPSLFRKSPGEKRPARCDRMTLKRWATNMQEKGQETDIRDHLLFCLLKECSPNIGSWRGMSFPSGISRKSSLRQRKFKLIRIWHCHVLLLWFLQAHSPPGCKEN